MSATWTDDRVETLAKLWKDGLSASQIARSLGGVTRNAVIGKVHRLGLCGRATPHVPGAGRPDQRRERRGRIPPKKARRPPQPPAPSPLPLPETGLASIVSVGLGQCRWPIGEPQDETFCLCGRPRTRGAYCASHAVVAYRPTERNHLVKLAGRAALM
jgi:GcrA cell cycle regulator